MSSPASHRVTTAADGTPVLVKRSTGPEGRARLAGEAAVLRTLAHPGLVRVVDLRDDADGAELHLAWVGPHSLATVTSVPVADAARLVARVADVVDDLHRAGVVHGRLTPDHVLLGADGAPVLTGLAEAGGTATSAPAVDVAALGALLTDLVAPSSEAPIVPERRHPRRADSGLRAALLTVADLAASDDATSIPSARALADRVRVTVGDGVPRSRRRHRRRGRTGASRAALAPGGSARPDDHDRPEPDRPPSRTGPGAPTPDGPSDPSHRPPAEAPTAGPPRPEPLGVAPPPGVGPASAPAGDPAGVSRPPAARAPAPALPPGPARPASPSRHRTPPRAGRCRRPAVALRRRWDEVPPGRRVAAVGLAAAVATTLLAVGLVRGPDSGTDDVRTVPSTTLPPSRATSPPATRPGTVPPTTGAPTPRPEPAPDPSCPPVAAAGAADVDGDGCPDAVRVEAERVTAAGTTWVVGRPGDAVAVADWDCDGTATVASLRPSTGEVFVFDRWVAPGDELTVPAATTVPGARDLAAVDPDGDGCAELTATRPDGPPVAVPLGGA
ncbi:hypothetical protein PO878_13965 [Iamia majanohamensis]|uniref:Protein kinase domain-containing protein n=1 Tax=Iamia majanohamensis TaxID=467976 RepID=A0AAE9YD45_9ACTN|nr:hypothetical protein [Iamia majanohamensis]WCO65606.1 hypothetical protein PO878_13965 [Iamia majanohamensis]